MLDRISDNCLTFKYNEINIGVAQHCVSVWIVGGGSLTFTR